MHRSWRGHGLCAGHRGGHVRGTCDDERGASALPGICGDGNGSARLSHRRGRDVRGSS